MIDKAILRPGRLELHLEIGLPDEHGRKQIFEIHTRQMKKNNLLGSDVSIDELSKMTKNYTGAEIEAVCGLACSYALFGHDNAEGVAKKIKEERKKGTKFEEKQVTRSEFMQALTEIKPDFGVDDVALERQFLGGIYNYSDQFANVFKHCEDLVHSMHNTSSANPLLSIMLEGDSGSGKTALAAKIAVDSGFPFVKLISPEMFVGQPDFVKVQKITKIFQDAYKSPLSLIVLDNIERLLEYVAMGCRFSNTILQTLLVLVKQKPHIPDHKLLIIGTTSVKFELGQLGVPQCFQTCRRVDNVKSANDIQTILSNFNCSTEEVEQISTDFETLYAAQSGVNGVPIKTLLLAVELAIERNGKGMLELESFVSCLESVRGDQM